MVENLTEQKLVEYGFSRENIEKLLHGQNEEQFLIFGEQHIWASNVANRILSGIDASRKFYFRNEEQIAFPFWDLNLINEYYHLREYFYLKRQKAIAGISFQENATKERFIENEVGTTNKIIDDLKSKPVQPNSISKSLEKYLVYLDWLKDFQARQRDKLSTLKENNKFYHSDIENYYKKLETASSFLSTKEFIEDEIERVEKIFIKPSTITVSGNFKFKSIINPDKYVGLAFFWLKEGNNWAINKILDQARNEYQLASASLNYTEIERVIETEIIMKSILYHLQRGVALLMYQKFLKEQDKQEMTKAPEKKTHTIEDILDNDATKIIVIREAIKDLCIVRASQDRTITGFIDGCKEASALPNISTTEIFKAMYFELNKTLSPTSKPRYDKATYTDSLAKTKKYFGIKN